MGLNFFKASRFADRAIMIPFDNAITKLNMELFLGMTLQGWQPALELDQIALD
jgi:hypothetical protein